MTNYRAGIIGCGRPSAGVDSNMQGYSIAYSHGDAFRNSGKANIVAAADISVDNAAAYAEHFAVPATYSDYKEMIDRENLDIVSVCTWPALHKEMVIYAAKSSVKMIWCEKPLTVGLDDLDEMLQVCKEQGVRLFINHQRRFVRPYQAVRKMLDDGALGKLLFLEGWVGSGWDLMTWGTHWIDMHRYFTHDEEVEWVVSSAPHAGKTRYGHPVEDHMLLQFGFGNGVISTIHLGNHVKSTALRITGEDGTVFLEDGSYKLNIQHGKHPAELFQQYKDDTPVDNGMLAALQDIISAFENNARSEIDGVNGAKTTEIVLAAYQASVERSKLVFPLVNRSFNLLRDYR